MSARKKPTRPRRVRLLDDPLAWTTNGDPLVGVRWSTSADRLDAVVAAAVASGRPIWIGVGITRAEADAITRDLRDAAYDTTLRLGSPLVRASKRAR